MPCSATSPLSAILRSKGCSILHGPHQDENTFTKATRPCKSWDDNGSDRLSKALRSNDGTGLSISAVGTKEGSRESPRSKNPVRITNTIAGSKKTKYRWPKYILNHTSVATRVIGLAGNALCGAPTRCLRSLKETAPPRAITKDPSQIHDTSG